MKKWSTILNSNPNVDNVFKFNVSYTKTKEDGTLKQYNYAVDIPDSYADMVIGERKVIKQLKKAWETAETAQDLSQFYTYLSARISEVKENFKYKWGAMIDANDLYFNPLWNVDGTEIVEEDRAKRKTTETLGEREDSTVYGEQENTNEYGEHANTNVYGAQETTTEYGQHEITDAHGNGQSHTDTYAHGAQHKTTNFGNGSSYTDQIQYGLDKTENTAGPRTNTTENKVNPFNDSNTEYETDKRIETTVQVVDTTERKVHTDTTTHGTHTDAEDLQSYSDSTTYGAYSDKQTSSRHEDTVTATTHTDTLTSGTHTDTLTTGTHTDTINKGEQENVTENDAYKDTITTTRHGNIGVTKSTELLRDYRNLPSECYTPILKDIMSILSRGY